MDHLPTYNPLFDTTKEALHACFAKNMVHLIPLVIIFCAMALWFFSLFGKNDLYPFLRAF